MLEDMCLTPKIDDEKYKHSIKAMEKKLAYLQRECKKYRIPVMIVFEGWDASGKGTLINELILPLDPRGFNTYYTKDANEDEYYRPYLWRFWNRTPEHGRIVIFDEGWYRILSVDKVDDVVSKPIWENAFDDIKTFEKQLTDDGTVIIKFFLHISKKEQKRRLIRLKSKSATSWTVTEKDWLHHEKYDELQKAYNEMLKRTDWEHSPWTVVAADEKKHAKQMVYTTVVEKLEEAINKAIQEENAGKIPVPLSALALEGTVTSILGGINLSKTITRKDYETELKDCQTRIREIEYEIYKKRIPIVIVYEGWDAAGKGGNIKRLVQNMDPRGYEVIPVAAPNDVEKNHHYLWRFWKSMPKAGHFAIFDRSWYGRVMVERVEGFCTEAEWKRAFYEINAMEAQLASFGTVVIKFWLHIDQEEQLKRFEARQNDPYKIHKITDEDWRNREKWIRYEEAVEEMLFRTNTPHAPWTIVESNCKHYARIKALKTVIEVIEKRL